MPAEGLTELWHSIETLTIELRGQILEVSQLPNLHDMLKSCFIQCMIVSADGDTECALSVHACCNIAGSKQTFRSQLF